MTKWRIRWLLLGLSIVTRSNLFKDLHKLCGPRPTLEQYRVFFDYCTKP